MPCKSLYEPSFEHDACGIGMLVNLHDVPSHQNVIDAIEILDALTHRGGVGYEPLSGDGAGLLMKMPDVLMRKVAAQANFSLPEGDHNYAVAMLFANQTEQVYQQSLDSFERLLTQQNLTVLGQREVPHNAAVLGTSAANLRPRIVQVFIAKPLTLSAEQFAQKLYVVSQQAQHQIRDTKADDFFYVASLSANTIVYKGMLLPNQLAEFYLDLKDPDLATSIALVHSRFSTNTYPSWERAHPMRNLIHNGEINTVRGNANWVHAREAAMKSSSLQSDLAAVFPTINESGSDSAQLDNFISLLVHNGWSLPEAISLAIPEPWEENQQMDAAKRAMYEYKSFLCEPWDGPASVAFTDGRYAGATLDRNGLRPSRYYVTADDRLILSSEVGVLPIDESTIIRKDRLRPGMMLLVDTQEGRIVEDAELKATMAKRRPYAQWLNENRLSLANLPYIPQRAQNVNESFNGELISLAERQTIFGYNWEDLTLTLKGICEKATDPIASMGYDAPLAVFSARPQLLYNYFKQLFAQVTNPPIDAIREHLVTSSITHLGAEGNILEPAEQNCAQLSLDTPFLSAVQYTQILALTDFGEKILDPSEYKQAKRQFGTVLKTKKLSICFDAKHGDLPGALAELFKQVDVAVAEHHTVIILSDEAVSWQLAPIPALLAVAGVHHHLVRRGLRTQTSLVIASGEPREVHHMALLVGYGANAIYPYLAYETITNLADQNLLKNLSAKQAVQNYIEVQTSSLVKVMSKMGISCVRSYQGAQIFEAVGLHKSVIEPYFTGTPTRIGGAGLASIAADIKHRHAAAFSNSELSQSKVSEATLAPGGEYRWRKSGEYHLLNPETIWQLQQAVRTGNYDLFKEFSANIDNQAKHHVTLRSLLQLQVGQPLDITKVEPPEQIVQRFKTGAMSFGSISAEAHTTMAIAMNRLKAKSNTGEGGEDPARFEPLPNGDSAMSAVKQVASGRFGVTGNYLQHASEIQIKMAQGAKPGEGGHLPGKKVYPWVAKNRFSTPGVELISPPPHHDIYSIEDMAQLIHDLKCANDQARINVKLVSEVGVGTVAVGVAKGLADVITISGFDGGTGAASRTSIRHAGLPWELGLAEAHQCLVQNKLRNKVRLETDGKLFTGRDIIVAALLGAEEFTFATLPLVALGCDMMRVCNLDTCPVGIATQNPKLRAKFQGKPEHIQNLMLFIAREVQEYLALLGLPSLDDAIGRADLLSQVTDISELDAHAQFKIKDVDLSRLLFVPDPDNLDRSATQSDYYLNEMRKFNLAQDHQISLKIDSTTILPNVIKSMTTNYVSSLDLPVTNRNRTLGTTLSAEIVKLHGAVGLPPNTISLNLQGAGGQSFGAWLAPGVSLNLTGDANDYLGKGMSGGRIVVKSSGTAQLDPHTNIICGNVAFFGATGGEAYIAGVAGERFAVRNSGATVVVEGVGEHGLEYMTGGLVLVLGQVGRNFAAGMSGGTAYVYDEDGTLRQRLNAVNIEVSNLSLSDATDRKVIQDLLSNHIIYTGSAFAQDFLDSFNDRVEHIVKLVPQAYQRITAAIARYLEQGLSEDEAQLQAFEEVTNG